MNDDDGDGRCDVCVVLLIWEVNRTPIMDRHPKKKKDVRARTTTPARRKRFPEYDTPFIKLDRTRGHLPKYHVLRDQNSRVFAAFRRI